LFVLPVWRKSAAFALLLDHCYLLEDQTPTRMCPCSQVQELELGYNPMTTPQMPGSKEYPLQKKKENKQF